VEGRLQSGLAVSAERECWDLVNASPDIARQIEQHLQPSTPRMRTRSSPIARIFLTNADLDHVLGLLLLRENGSPLRAVAPSAVRAVLSEQLRIEAVLGAFCGIEWVLPPAGVEAIALRGTQAPRFATSDRHPAAVGYIFRDATSGKCAGFFPDVAQLDEELLARLSGCDVLFFDGTFWSEDEMLRAEIADRPASAMGHIPISGPQGSLERLAALKLPLCAYLHINNTNPILLPHSPERKAVEARGLQVASDGMRLTL
jgi:pyrroloquinoline quinone biosynthesis protein B